MTSPKVLTQTVVSGYDPDKEIQVGSLPQFEPGVVIVKAMDDEKCVRVKLTPDEADSLAEMLTAVAQHARAAAVTAGDAARPFMVLSCGHRVDITGLALDQRYPLATAVMCPEDLDVRHVVAYEEG